MPTISINYALKWQIKDATHYQFTTCGKLINVRTEKEIKQILCSRSIGYCIKGKFQSLKSLRPKIEKIPKEICPF
jgi:hypothetical protein